MSEINGKFILDDSEVSIPNFSPVCTFCRHVFVEENRKCAAFPEGIPMEIWLGKNRHTEAFEGDGGIRFELAPTVLPAVAQRYGFEKELVAESAK